MIITPFREPELTTRPLPANTEAEQALLGAILINNAAHGRVAAFLVPEHFGTPVHGRIYTAIGKLIERGQIANPVTLKTLFDQDGALGEIGGVRYLARLAESAVTIINTEYYGRTILDLAQRRGLIEACQETIDAAFQADLDRSAEDLLAGHKERLDVAVAEPLPIVKATPFAWTDPASLPRREWLYGRHLIRGFVSADTAPGGTGKTALIVAEALAMTSGRPLLGDEPQGKLRVWLINLEDPIDELQRRVAATALHYGLGLDDIGDRLFLDSGRDGAIVVARDGRDGIEIARPVVNAIRTQIAANRIDALIVDPFVACHTVAENDNGKIAAVARLWAGIADATGCAIDLVHHARKIAPGQMLTADDARGASALIAAVRSARVLNVMTKEEAERAGIDSPRRYFSVTSGKANLAPSADKATWRRLVGVSLGNGSAPEDPGDNIGVVESWTWPDLFADVSVTDLGAMQAKLAAGEWRADHRSPSWAGVAVAEVLDLDIQQSAVRASVREMLKTWVATGALREVTRQDGRRKRRKYVEPGDLA